MPSDSFLRAMASRLNTVRGDRQDAETELCASVLLHPSFHHGPHKSKSLVSGGDFLHTGSLADAVDLCCSTTQREGILLCVLPERERERDRVEPA